MQEETLYNEVKEAIKDYPKFLEDIEAFDGCESEIQRSIEKPGSSDLEEATWNALIPRIKCLHQQYLFLNTQFYGIFLILEHQGTMLEN